MASELIPLSISLSPSQHKAPSERTVRRMHITVQLFGSATERLVLGFSGPGGFVQRATAALAYTLADRPAIVDYPEWRYVRDGEVIRHETRGETGLVFHPNDGDTIDVDIPTVPDEPYYGRADVHDCPTKLPDGPLTVDRGSIVQQLRGLGEQYGPLRQTFVPSADNAIFEAVLSEVRLLARHHDRHSTLEGFSFDTSLETYETLFFEGESVDSPTVGPIRDEWLEWYALEHDVVERLIADRISERDLEEARLQYKTLLSRHDEITERVLRTLQANPDPKAVTGLLPFVWSDVPEFAPAAIEILGTILATHDELEEPTTNRPQAITDIERLVEQSDHPDIRIAAIDALATIGADRSRDAIVEALDDSHAPVQRAAKTALERLENGN